MNKQTFCLILQVALLSFDKVSENDMIFNYGLNPQLVKVWIKLCEYLQGIKIKWNNNKKSQLLKPRL